MRDSLWPPPEHKTFFVCISLRNKESRMGGRAEKAHSTFSLYHTCSAVYSLNLSGKKKRIRPSHYNQIQMCHWLNPLTSSEVYIPSSFSPPYKNGILWRCHIIRVIILQKVRGDEAWAVPHVMCYTVFFNLLLQGIRGEHSTSNVRLWSSMWAKMSRWKSPVYSVFLE